MDNKLTNVQHEDIKNLIYTIRGKQVMLDSDVAWLYKCETKYVNRVMKRNVKRFPEDFCFQITEKEYQNLRCQFVTSSLRKENYGGRRYLPYVFTEQGISMLSPLLKNEIAIEASIKIMRAFVEMRKFMMTNAPILERLTTVEYKLLEHDKNFDKLFNALQKDENFKQKLFFKGQIYDAYSLIIDIIKRAKKKIVIIDNYVDESVLEMLTKKNKNVEAVILTSFENNKISKLDVQKFNKEYPVLKLAKTDKFHDRFIIIDSKELYHCGASIKDLGKKCFAINKIEDESIIRNIIKHCV
ncbi:MAG: ORF6N domain-containing protein [Oscillospiraceae bacterium]|nr:ORF6N domain-containing protein [Oscillospiraceae bacterium]